MGRRDVDLGKRGFGAPRYYPRSPKIGVSKFVFSVCGERSSPLQTGVLLSVPICHFKWFMGYFVE